MSFVCVCCAVCAMTETGIPELFAVTTDSSNCKVTTDSSNCKVVWHEVLIFLGCPSAVLISLFDAIVLIYSCLMRRRYFVFVWEVWNDVVTKHSSPELHEENHPSFWRDLISPAFIRFCAFIPPWWLDSVESLWTLGTTKQWRENLVILALRGNPCCVFLSTAKSQLLWLSYSWNES